MYVTLLLSVVSPFPVRTLTLGLVLLVVPFLPACNVFFRVGFVIAERVLYLSSAGYCLLLAFALGHCCCRWTKHRVGAEPFERRAPSFQKKVALDVAATLMLSIVIW